MSSVAKAYKMPHDIAQDRTSRTKAEPVIKAERVDMSKELRNAISRSLRLSKAARARKK